MQIVIIGEYEVSYDAAGEPALIIHHVVRGYDAAGFDAATAAELGALLAVRQKRIRELGSYRAVFGAGGDVTLYTATNQRAVYLTSEQAARLATLLTATS
ncbi:MAG: hypothetical protein HXY37_09315 [Chloroflexi bacterium]|nr:hypothetical protein [Chloroflexota bacterium]